jgi:hypothetical protein
MICLLLVLLAALLTSKLWGPALAALGQRLKKGWEPWWRTPGPIPESDRGRGPAGNPRSQRWWNRAEP